ncbi:Hypothetical protein NCS54_01191400 [Fusarium falciforme]|uniref:Hypothetical protein n=1 Tax=Fusarium falciforme TaxID=195108 RepID=UPI0023019EA8|nr:Hypothetical protein NCS54_01191400 [Fusarium falciforme]WAO94335.1 Hypothetical protein NCS54_01191400 [Fusarium falciforme]
MKSDFTAIFNKICTLIETLEPDIVLIDPIFSPGITARKHMKSRVSKAFTFTIFSPNSMKDYVHHLEPRDKVRELTNIPQLELIENLSMLHTSLDGIDRVPISGRLETDFPCLDLVGPPKACVDKIPGCGPILQPLENIDGDLAAWLSRGPVIYINLGTHCLTSETEAVEMARSLTNLIDVALDNNAKYTAKSMSMSLAELCRRN